MEREEKRGEEREKRKKKEERGREDSLFDKK